MDIRDRIFELNRIKIQLLISWLTHQEIEALINASEQELEDYILDNISKSGRGIILQGLGYSEDDFQNRKKVRITLNNHYLNLIGKENEEALKGSERKAMQKKALEMLGESERDVYMSRFHEKSSDLGDGFHRKLEEYVDKLEKGQGLT